MKKDALIMNMQKFSLDDGPGIRTTVFFKGCPLRCAWCHNPESFLQDRQITFDRTLCIECGRCEQVCPDHIGQYSELDSAGCAGCFLCAMECPGGALSISGKHYGAEDMINACLKDMPFYRKSGGGITFSGGEPLLQAEALIEMLFGLKKEGVHTCIDTSCMADKSVIDSVLPLTDLFLVDLKAFDAKLHRNRTGMDNRVIKSNIEYLSEREAAVWIRIPIVETDDDAMKDYIKIAKYIRSETNIKHVDLLPYHRYGDAKYSMLGLDTPCYKTPEKSVLNYLSCEFLEEGLDVRIN